MSSGDLNCSIYVIDPRIDQRVTIREALKELGYNNVKVGGTIKEILKLLETEAKPADWIITSFMTEDEINALQLLGLCVTESYLHATRISLIVAPEEKKLLPKAFGLGLMSYHMKPFTKVSLSVDFLAVSERLQKDETHGCFTAGYFLRNILLDQDDYSSATRFTESLIRLYPNNAQLFVDLAEVQQLSGDPQAALRTLAQAKHLGVDLAKAAKQIEELIKSDLSSSQSDAEPAGVPESFAAAFGLNTVVVIEPDESVQNILKEILNELGVKSIEIFSDGEAAWGWIDKNIGQVSAIIQEWRVPKLSGPALVQRYRDKGLMAPVIVFSGLVKKSDKHLLREIGVAQLIEKPLSREYFTPQFMATIRQELYPTSFRIVSRQFQQAVTSKNTKLAKIFYDKLLASKDVPNDVILLTKAEWLFLDEKFEDAKKHVFEAMAAGGDSLRLLNLLGKIFMKLRKFEDAIKCMNKAQEMSSQNLERLCMLAEAQAEVGDFSVAQDTIDKAKTVDASNRKVAQTEARVALSSGDAELTKELIGKLDSLVDIVAYTNNRAVSLSRQNKIDEALGLYETALKSLPKSESELLAKLKYNLALGYLRRGDVESAEKILGEAAAIKGSSIASKIDQLHTRVSQAIMTGKTIQIKVDEETVQPPSAKVAPADEPFNIVAIDVRPGEMCCHLVYVADAKDNQAAQPYLRKLPRFILRKNLKAS